MRCSQHPGSVKHQRGVALMTAMLVVAISTLLAAELLWQQHLGLRRVESSLNHEQARQYALGAEAWAIDALRSDDDRETDSLEDGWATAIAPLEIEGGMIEGYVEDMQGRLNLNNLVKPDGEENELVVLQFHKLLRDLELEESIAEEVMDWIDQDQDTRIPDGAEDDRYTGRQPAYRTANNYLSSTSELLAVQSVDIEAYRALEPWVSALPPGWCGATGDVKPININTAPEQVLLAIDEDVNEGHVEMWISDREENGAWSDFSMFTGIVREDVLNAGYLDTKSSCFALTVYVNIGTTRLSMYSLLDRVDNDDLILTRYRRFGVN